LGSRIRTRTESEITGYLSYDWYRESHKIAAIRRGAIRLLEYSRYGVLSSGKMPRRLVVRNLLCELDQPGEWYFDGAEGTLFLWPFEPIRAKTNLGCWSGPSFAVLSGTSHVTIRDIQTLSLLISQPRDGPNAATALRGIQSAVFAGVVWDGQQLGSVGPGAADYHGTIQETTPPLCV
jgi:hypothetical protein